ncbi:hypothetical protein [[Mycobacterium] appelbergii]|nr:hypothetical protein [Mycobacterium sp. 21AC1]
MLSVISETITAVSLVMYGRIVVWPKATVRLTATATSDTSSFQC